MVAPPRLLTVWSKVQRGIRQIYRGSRRLTRSMATSHLRHSAVIKHRKAALHLAVIAAILILGVVNLFQSRCLLQSDIIAVAQENEKGIAMRFMSVFRTQPIHDAVLLKTLDSGHETVLDTKRSLLNLLTSNGSISSITLPNSDGFNPSILPMPLGSSYPYWVVFRRESSKRDGNYNELVSCFLRQIDGGDLICDSSLVVLHDTQYDRSLTPFVNLGPEDPRIMFGLQGQPLLVYGNTSTIHDRGIWIRDLREAFRPHEFIDHFPVGFFDNVPLTLNHPTEFILPGTEWRKDVYPLNDFIDNKIYLLDHAPKPEPLLLPFDEHTGNTTNPVPDRNSLKCLRLWLGDSNMHEIRAGTNMLRIVLCNRDDDCTPTRDNTIRFGIVRYRFTDKEQYSPLVVTMYDYAPFNYRSMSSRLSFHESTAFRDISSILFVSPTRADEIGYLDSLVMISLGEDPTRCGAMVVKAVDLIREHYVC